MDFGLWASGFGLWASVLGLRSLGLGPWASIFGLRSSGFGLRASGFGLRYSGFGLRSLGFGLRSLVSRLGTPCFVVLFEYRSGHSNSRELLTPLFRNPNRLISVLYIIPFSIFIQKIYPETNFLHPKIPIVSILDRIRKKGDEIFHLICSDLFSFTLGILFHLL